MTLMQYRLFSLFLSPMKKNGLLLIFILFLGSITRAGDKSGIEISGDILEYVMPAAALTSTFIWKDGSNPTWQFAKSFGVAVGSAYVLKQVIHKARPDNTETSKRYDSFPSGHTTSAFTSAAFLERRYGWKVGVPSYLVAAWVGYSRVYAERHDGWDVLAGAALGTASSYLFTKTYKKNNLDVAFNVAPNTYKFGVVYRF